MLYQLSYLGIVLLLGSSAGVQPKPTYILPSKAGQINKATEIGSRDVSNRLKIWLDKIVGPEREHENQNPIEHPKPKPSLFNTVEFMEKLIILLAQARDTLQ
jgi:hypothetical protein